MSDALIVEVRPPGPNFSRWMLTVLALICATFAWGTSQVDYIAWPIVWAGLFAAAAVLCAYSAVRFDHTGFVVVCGPLILVACVFRAAALVLGRSQSLLANPWPVVVQGAVLWAGFGFLATVLFLRGIVPLWSMRRAEIERTRE